jgi:hypothetical protein
MNEIEYHYTGKQRQGQSDLLVPYVPDLVATKDRKGLSAMDIVAVLTKVVQEQKETVEKQQAVINTLTEKLAQLEAKMEGLQTGEIPLSILFQK